MSEVLVDKKNGPDSKLPIPYSEMRKREVIRLQGEFQIKHKRKITAIDLAAAIFDEGLKTYRI